MAKQAEETKTTAANASKTEKVELVKLEIISEKVIKIGGMKVGKGHRDSLPKDQAEALIKDGVAVKIY